MRLMSNDMLYLLNIGLKLSRPMKDKAFNEFVS
jgi:hypothetical protein